MNYTLSVLCLCLGLSLAANWHLFRRYKSAQKAPTPTQDAKEILSQIMRGNAVIQIRVLDPENIMYRSPRG